MIVTMTKLITICKICKKKFKGDTERQANTQRVIHMITKHPDKVKMVEKK